MYIHIHLSIYMYMCMCIYIYMVSLYSGFLLRITNVTFYWELFTHCSDSYECFTEEDKITNFHTLTSSGSCHSLQRNRTQIYHQI